jgi:hypothetical protein
MQIVAGYKTLELFIDVQNDYRFMQSTAQLCPYGIICPFSNVPVHNSYTYTVYRVRIRFSQDNDQHDNKSGGFEAWLDGCMLLLRQHG